MKYQKKNKRKFKKVFIIQNKSEVDYLEDHKKFISCQKIIWYPINFLDNRSQKYIYADTFLNEKKKYNFDVSTDFYLNSFFKKIDKKIRQNIKEIPNSINIFSNSKHEFKNYFDFYFNEFAKIEYLIKNFNCKYIYVFSSNKKCFSPRIESVLNYFKNPKIKVIQIHKKFSNNLSLSYYHEDVLKPDFLKKKYNFNEKIKSFLKNIYLNKWSYNKEKILIIDGNKFLLNSIKNIQNKKFNFFNIQNIFLNTQQININKNQHNSIVSNIKSLEKDLGFFPKSKNFDFFKFFFDFTILNYKSLTSFALNIYNFITTLDDRHNFKLAISQNEVFYSNIIHDYFINKKKKFLALSHGGTIGHYKNSPRVPFYNLQTNRFSYYQSFSKEMEKHMKRLIKNKNKNYNFLELPHIVLTELKASQLINKKSYKKNLVYFASPLDGYLDSKFDVHNEFNILKIRKNFFQNVKNFNIIYRGGYRSKINQSYKSFVNLNFKNVKISSDKTPINKLLEIADIIVCEGNSSVIIESLTVKKPTILFQRKYPEFDKITQKLLNKRIVIYKNTSDILNLTKNFKSLSFDKYNFHDNSLLNFFYNYKSISHNNFKKRLEDFLNK